MMNEYAVKLIATAVDRDPDSMIKAFYDALDGVIAARSGQWFLTVYGAQSSGVEAAQVAIQALEELGFSVIRVDPDLVDIPEIATRLDLTRQAVHQWATGDRRASFPPPLGSPGGKRIWAWGDILQWVRSVVEIDEPALLTLDEAAQIDNFLVGRRAVGRD